MIRIIAFLLFGVLILASPINSTYAVSKKGNPAIGLKVAPLTYKTKLEESQKKKGFITISNPSSAKVVITTSVQAFRQIDNQGNLVFYDDEQVKRGVKLDLHSFELGPRQALKMAFLLDGTKLSSGDTFAAIFFTTKPKIAEGSMPVTASVRVGTLVSIVNGTPGLRDATVMSLDGSWLQLGDSIAASYSIKNTANPNASTGFYPTVVLSKKPFNSQTRSTSSLVFGGNTRSNNISIAYDWPSVYKIRVQYRNSFKELWVLAVRPMQLAAIIGTIVFIVAAFILSKARQRPGRRRVKRRR